MGCASSTPPNTAADLSQQQTSTATTTATPTASPPPAATPYVAPQPENTTSTVSDGDSSRPSLKASGTVPEPVPLPAARTQPPSFAVDDLRRQLVRSQLRQTVTGPMDGSGAGAGAGAGAGPGYGPGSPLPPGGRSPSVSVASSIDLESVYSARRHQYELDACDNINKAVVADHAGQYESARTLYQEGIHFHLLAAEAEPDEASRTKLADQIAPYMERVRVLTAHIEEARKLADDTAQRDSESRGYFDNGQFCAEQAVREDQKGNQAPAKDLYMDAAEWFLKCINAKPIPSVDAAAKQRATQVLKRAEELKDALESIDLANMFSAFKPPTHVPVPPTAPAPSPAPAPAPTRTPGPAPSPSPAPAPAPSPSRPPVASQATSGDFLTADEKAVLKHTSVVNSRVFLPWMDSDIHDRFAFPKPFTDPDGLLQLSAKQKQRLAGWKRPSEFMTAPTMIHLVSAYSITQELVTDCSFVASLCISALYERRFRKQLITSIIYPQDRLGRPVYNPSGKYMVKLHFNGIPHKVVVDDLIPVDKHNRPLSSFSSNRNELWVTIIEKAYLKVNGGYDFPGSNSGIDLHALTGWVPESMRTKADDFQPDRTWERLLSGNRYGDCLITIATGPMSAAEEERWGLVESHAYAVLDVREVRGLRLLQVKNPWAHKRWKGAFSVEDTSSWTPFLRSALHFDQVGAMQYDNGIFWIDYASVLKHFHSIYFNWNPKLFKYHKTLHAAWPLAAPGPRNDRYTVGDNPQYALRIRVPPAPAGNFATPKSSTAAVWLLLTRHVLEKEVEESDRNRTALAGGSDADNTKDFLALHVFKDSGDSKAGQRIYYPGDAWLTGSYMNNPHILVRFDVPPGDHLFTLVVSQYQRWRDVYYTLDAFCMAPLGVGPVPELFPRKVQKIGEWTPATAGGSSRYHTFFDNPQVSIRVTERTNLFLAVKAPVKYPANVRLYAAGGQRVMGAGVQELGSSGSYRPGFSYVVLKGLEPGTYTALVSTYEPSCVGKFIFIVGSSHCDLGVTILPEEGAGGHKKVINQTWSLEDGSAAGCANHRRFEANPKLLMTVSRPATLTLRLKAPSMSPPPHINLAVFACEPGTRHAASYSLSSAVVATNDGVYSNPPAGFSTPSRRFESGQYVVVSSTFDPTPGRFEVRCLSDVPVDLVPI